MSPFSLHDIPDLTEPYTSTATKHTPPQRMSTSSIGDLVDMTASIHRPAPPPPPPRDDQNRRSACDRCRRQKLRCERRPSASTLDPCKRCIKSRSKCVTGPSLPMGRPRIRTRSASPFDYRSMKRDFHPLVADYMPPMSRIRRDRTPPTVTATEVPSLQDIPCTDMTAMNVLAHGPVSLMQAEPEQKYVSDCGYNDYGTNCSSTNNTVVPNGHNSWDDSINALQDLTSRLLEICHSMNNNTNTHWSYSDQNSLNPYGPYIGNNIESRMGSTISVGNLIDISNEFLKLSQVLMFPQTNITPMSSRHSSVDCGGMGYASMGYQRIHSGSISYAQNPSPTLYDERESEFSPSSIPSLTSSISTAAAPSAARTLDYTTLLTLFSSYTTLLRIHRTTLTRIHLALLSQPMPWNFLESLLPGLYPDGLATEQRPDSQVRFFVQVVKGSLEQMERSVGCAAKMFSSGPEADMGTVLLNTMVKAEATESAARIVAPQRIVDEILRTMDGGIGAM